MGRIWRLGLPTDQRYRFIEFVGRKSAYPGAYGHFGMSRQYIVVDRVLAVRDCPDEGACR